jgi:hypothetical protein
MVSKTFDLAPATAAPVLDYSRYPQIATTELVAKVQEVEDEVRRKGALILTRYNKPCMVLVTLERFAEMESRNRVDMTGLEAEFETKFAKMQQPSAAEAMGKALRMGVKRMGDIAHAAAVKDKSERGV